MAKLFHMKSCNPQKKSSFFENIREKNPPKSDRLDPIEKTVCSGNVQMIYTKKKYFVLEKSNHLDVAATNSFLNWIQLIRFGRIFFANILKK